MTMPQAAVLSALMPVLQRHLQAYADTAAEDAALWMKDLRRRLLAAFLAVAGASMFLMLASAWIVGTMWNTPWRNAVIGALLGIFLVCAIAGAAFAARSFRPGQAPFARLRHQLKEDLLAPGGAGADASAFPRSISMRYFLHWTGLSQVFQ